MNLETIIEELNEYNRAIVDLEDTHEKLMTKEYEVGRKLISYVKDNLIGKFYKVETNTEIILRKLVKVWAGQDQNMMSERDVEDYSNYLYIPSSSLYITSEALVIKKDTRKSFFNPLHLTMIPLNGLQNIFINTSFGEEFKNGEAIMEDYKRFQEEIKSKSKAKEDDLTRDLLIKL